MYEHLKGLVEYHLHIAKTINVSGITEGVLWESTSRKNLPLLKKYIYIYFCFASSQSILCADKWHGSHDSIVQNLNVSSPLVVSYPQNINNLH